MNDGFTVDIVWISSAVQPNADIYPRNSRSDSTEFGNSGSPASDDNVQCSGPAVRIALYILAGLIPRSGDSSSNVKFSHNPASAACFISSILNLTNGLKG